ncbi:MAG: NAD-dependent protein deacetylase [Planctomycetes bacterium]|nr:NAD-dependent protein deacetylase [Planctomycetota bacterium]
MTTTDGDIARAAAAVRQARAIVVSAGAGMGVDSGLPDFRGPEGFWRAYPPYRALGLRFEDMADPRWFREDPGMAWGFYGHRLALYRRTRPHAGFQVLRRWADRAPHGGFVYTSNVDGQFQRAGFDPERVAECHGAIEFVQCTGACQGISPGEGIEVEVDEATFRARDPLPTCAACGALLRPNILMFGDWGWDASRADAQEARLERWLEEVAGEPAVVIECGAGTSIPTVRRFSERTARALDATLVRLNVREPDVPPGHVGLPLGAKEALERIDALVSGG